MFVFLLQADLDMDYINFLLSSDHNIPDILTENSSNTPGCSDWIHTDVSEAQIQSTWTPQTNSSPSKTTDLHLPQDQITFHASKTHAFQEIMMGNELQTLPELLFADHEAQNTQTDQNDSIRESVNPESDRNNAGQQNETLFVDSVTQTLTKNIENHLKLEYDGDKSMADQKYQDAINIIDGSDTNSEFPTDSQSLRVKTNTTKTDGNTVNEIKRSTRRKHPKITKPNERSAAENQDERTKTTGKTQRLARRRKI